jgi:translation initiation factor 5B
MGSIPWARAPLNDKGATPVVGPLPGLREPILSLLGHVDHGKTTLLDRIAGSARASSEAGGITQHIGALEVPGEAVLKICEGILDTDRFEVPGLLFVDTPGHRSFETLRRRGGALADLAILVIDAREGVMPQTRESIQILRHEKTPFLVALTKIDLITGWRKPTGRVALGTHLTRCGPEFGKLLDGRVYAVSEDLDRSGFSAERYDRVSDFSRNIGIVPVSAKSGVGIPELLGLVVGLAQRFLKAELAVATIGGEATILERSEQRGLGPVGNVIVYRGRLTVGDEIVVTGRSEPFVTKIRAIHRPNPSQGGRRAHTPKLDTLPFVEAAAGVYLSAPGLESALPGGLLKVVHNAEETEQVRQDLARESHPVTEIAENGIAIMADTLGGLEALAFECKEAKIPIHLSDVGPVNRTAVLTMAAVREPSFRAILAFNVPVLPDAMPEGDGGPVRIFKGEIMYRVLEEYQAWHQTKLQAMSVQRRLETVHPAKVQFLPGFVFRSSKPAIIGVKVLAGRLRAGVRLMHQDGTEVGLLRSLQKEGDSVPEAEEGTEIAASIDGAVVGRTLKEGEILYVLLPEAAARVLRTAQLTDSERAVLDEVVRLRRVSEPFWGA